VLYRLLRAAVTPPVGLLFRPRVEGLEHVPRRGPAILCANHLSFLDPIVVAIALPRPVYYLGKSEYFGRRWGWLFANLGVLPVVRRGGAAGESSLQRGRRVLEAGRLMGIYPEGTRSPDGRLYRGKTGAARLAIRTGAPVVPIGVAGTRKVWPPGTWLPRPRPVVVRFGPPLDFSSLRERGDARAALREATDALMSAIAGLSGQTYADVYADQARAAQSAPGQVPDLSDLRPDDSSLSLDEPRRSER